MAEVSYEQFKSFVHGHRYPRRWLPKQYARLQRPHPEASLETVQVYQGETKLLAGQLLELIRTNRALKKELRELFN